MKRLELAHLLVNAIKNGVELENGNVREVDPIDYYLFTNENYSKFMKMVSIELTQEEFKILNNNRAKVSTEPGLNNYFYLASDTELAQRQALNQIFSITLTVNVDFDENGNYIEGSGRTITDEEKMEIIDFINNLEVPFSVRLFNCAVKRLVNNIPLDDSMIKNVPARELD